MRTRTIEDLTGRRFGRLTVKSRAENKGYGLTAWNCVCECGTEKAVLSMSLRNGNSRSCGCLQRQAATSHGMRGSRVYNTWAQMKARCLNPRSRFFADYGGRGITVCDRWMSFEGFYADMGDQPKGKSLDRIDNSKGYSPENCRWATMLQQGRNKRNNRNLKFRGETRPVSEWAELMGIKKETVISRLNLGWSVEDALTHPVDSRKATKKGKDK